MNYGIAFTKNDKPIFILRTIIKRHCSSPNKSVGSILCKNKNETKMANKTYNRDQANKPKQTGCTIQHLLSSSTDGTTENNRRHGLEQTPQPNKTNISPICTDTHHLWGQA